MNVTKNTLSSSLNDPGADARHPVFEFGKFKLDMANSSLYCEGKKVALTPKAFSVIDVLMQAPGKLISKDELLDKAWAGRIVGDATLQVCIGEIRKALADDPKQPQYIETVPKKGYRFIAALKNTESSVPHQIPPDFTTPDMVGREDVLSQMETHLEQVFAEERQLILISGEPGIGKTTVAKAFLKKAFEQFSCTIAYGQCIDHQGTAEAYLPVLDALNNLSRSTPGDRVVSLLRQHAPMWLLQLPGLLTNSETEQLQQQLAGSAKQRMLREMAQFLEALSNETVLVILLEDLQWSDHATIDLLAYLGRRSEPARLLILGTYRPVEVILTHHPLQGLKNELLSQRQLHELSLELVTQHDVENYLRHRFPPLSEQNLNQLAQHVYHYTDGNPLFMVNFVAHIQEQGGLEQHNWTLNPIYFQQDTDIPKNLRDMIAHQFQRLSDQQLSILQAASVAGIEFNSAEVFAALSTDNDVEKTCEQLALNGHYIRALGLDEWPNDNVIARYQFTHALYRDVLYKQLPPLRRTQLHHRIGQCIEEAFGTQAPQLAHTLATHFEQARQYKKAIDYLRQAANIALRRHANDETIVYLKRALQWLEKRPDNEFRQQQEIEIQMDLGCAYQAFHGYASSQMGAAYARALTLCQQIGDETSLPRAMFGLSTNHFFRGKLHSAEAADAQLLAAAQHQQDAMLIMISSIGLGTVQFCLGKFSESRAHIELGLSHYDVTLHGQHAFQYGQDFAVIGMAVMSLQMWILGFPEQALDYAKKALDLAQKINHAFSETIALMWNIRLFHYLDKKSAVEQAAQRAFELSAQNQFAFFYSPELNLYKSAKKSHAEQANEFYQHYQDNRHYWENVGTTLVLPNLLIALARTFYDAEQWPRAQKMLDDALDVIQNIDENWLLAEIYRLQGELFDQQNAPPEHVEACYAQSLDVARRQQAKSFELRTLISLCRLKQRSGNAKEALAMLDTTYHEFTEGHDTADLQTAASILQQQPS